MIFGEDDAPKPACNLKDGDRMDDFTFYRSMLRGLVNSGVKGLYHETKIEPISKDCFGDWIDDEFDGIADYALKIYDDWWSFNFADATKVSNTLIGIHYKNMEACNFERI
jgi:hypothetical protein